MARPFRTVSSRNRPPTSITVWTLLPKRSGASRHNLDIWPTGTTSSMSLGRRALSKNANIYLVPPPPRTRTRLLVKFYPCTCRSTRLLPLITHPVCTMMIMSNKMSVSGDVRVVHTTVSTIVTLLGGLHHSHFALVQFDFLCCCSQRSEQCSKQPLGGSRCCSAA